MSIRFRIMLGCLALTLLTVTLGVFAQFSQRRLGAVALDLYDNAFMSVSYLRAAQLDFVGMERAPAAGTAAATENLLGDLDVAVERAMSPGGRARVQHLRATIAAGAGLLVNDPKRAASIQADFDGAVEIFAADAFRDRRRAEALVATEEARTWLLLIASVLAALLVTALLSHLVVPPLRSAVYLAQAIAAGRLENIVEANGRGETGDLLRALAQMQAAIAQAMARINALMVEQAQSHASELAIGNAQRKAALDNMNQGLCMYDSAWRLTVFNKRFADMFGAPEPGQHASDVLEAAGLGALVDLSAGGVAAVTCELGDGRVIAVSQQSVESGGWVATYEDISERRATEQKLAHRARHDLLTGLPNRLLFSEHVQSLLSRAHQNRRITLLCVDIDRFRVINDTLGPAAGDALLRAVGGRLRACVADRSGLVFRLGGNEFAVLHELRAGDDPAQLAEEVLRTLSEPFPIGTPHVEISVRLGSVCADDLEEPGDGGLLKCAEAALSQAKAEGGGRHCRFQPNMDVHLRQMRALEMELRQALPRGELELFYQPQIAPGRGIRGFESLLRWRHPERGLISPALFIPLAEDTGLIGPIGAWVTRQACEAAMRWPEELKVAVNLSPAQFRSRDVVAEVAGALAETGLPPHRLELEITEAVLLADDDAVLRTLRGLHGLGVRIAMDDFGTGYSSLGYLTRFPFDKIKIDQSFVRAMTTRADSLAIVRAVIGLGRSLGMAVNAEGVETPEQMAMLTAEGCDELQGYLFSRPQPEAFVADMVRAHGVAPRLALAA